MKRLRAQGIDPREHRLKEARAREAEAARRVTFNTYADTYIAAHRAAWRNAVHLEQWQSTIDTYVKPVFEGVAIADVDTALVMKALAPIWPVKPEHNPCRQGARDRHDGRGRSLHRRRAHDRRPPRRWNAAARIPQ